MSKQSINLTSHLNSNHKTAAILAVRQMTVYGMDKTHMATEIETPGCNGWAVIHKKLLDKDDGRNFHIVEVKIQKGSDNKEYIAGQAETTTCGLALKKSVDLSGCKFFRKEVQNAFRIQLAEWQNVGNELCGRCVGHFYKDPPKS